MKRRAFAEWSHAGKHPGGALTTQSGELAGAPFSANARFEDAAGTTPEELIAAACAGCFSMALARELARIGVAPRRICVIATVDLRQAGGTYAITEIHLAVKVSATGIDNNIIFTAAHSAQRNSPIARMIQAPLSLTTSLQG